MKFSCKLILHLAVTRFNVEVPHKNRFNLLRVCAKWYPTKKTPTKSAELKLRELVRPTPRYKRSSLYMCIVITSTLHPDYPLIVLSNRDEYFNRPTQLATERSIGNHKILSPIDLGREERGTWIGVTSSGKIAVLLNYREEKGGVSDVSRGVLPIEYLNSESVSDEEWLESLIKTERLGLIGGFSLIYGKLQLDPESRKLSHLNIMSNRGDRGKIHAQKALDDDLHRNISRKHTFSVSNSLYYHPWQKSIIGIDQLSGLVEESVKKQFPITELKNRCFDILSLNTYSSEVLEKGSAREKLEELQKSIFIPAIHMVTDASEERALTEYGTRTQTVIILDKSGKLSYYEKDMHSDIGEQHYTLQLQNFFSRK